MEHLAYFQALCGEWSGALRFVMTGRPAGIRNRTKAALLGQLGHVVMSTTLHAVSDTEFAHATWARRFGLTLFSSREQIRLDPDGRRFDVRGRQREWPGLWSTPLEGEGEATRAAALYRLEFLGAPLRQETAVVPEGLHVIQTTSFSRAEVVLRRGRPADER